MLANLSSLIIAAQFATLAQLYLNRIDLGLWRVAGTDPATAQAIRSDGFQAAHSFPEEIKKIQIFSCQHNIECVRGFGRRS